MDGEILRSVLGLAGVPLLVALTQMFKPFVPSARWYPLLAVCFGLVLNLLVAWAMSINGRAEWAAAALMGILAGLAASGLYSSARTLRDG